MTQLPTSLATGNCYFFYALMDPHSEYNARSLTFSISAKAIAVRIFVLFVCLFVCSNLFRILVENYNDCRLASWWNETNRMGCECQCIAWFVLFLFCCSDLINNDTGVVRCESDRYASHLYLQVSKSRPITLHFVFMGENECCRDNRVFDDPLTSVSETFSLRTMNGFFYKKKKNVLLIDIVYCII